MILYYTIYCYTIDTTQLIDTNVLLIKVSTSIKYLSSLASYSSISVISGASKGF